MDWILEKSKKRKQEKRTPRVKWWRLQQENDIKSQFTDRLLAEVKIGIENVQERWKENSRVIRNVGEVLGKSSDRKPTGNKETWWWNDELQKVIRAKREANKKWNISGSEEGKEAYKITNKVAKRVVAKSKAVALNSVRRAGNARRTEKDL